MFVKCKVCGTESGKYVLCRECNAKKDMGEIVKCSKCNTWHYKDYQCDVESSTKESTEITAQESSEILSEKSSNDVEKGQIKTTDQYLYELKNSLLSANEIKYYDAIKNVMPDGYLVFPQVNLASIINRTDGARFQNELFRNVDFLITDKIYQPKIILEINDRTHLTAERKVRDEKVQKICEEAGVPIIKLWTSYGVNSDYIKERITETLNELPKQRICHSKNSKIDNKTTNKKGCYIATSIYGSYDCASVWVLRRYRDRVLDNSWHGRLFIKIYYSISPLLVKFFGESKIFRCLFTKTLGLMVDCLKKRGYEDTPYID